MAGEPDLGAQFDAAVIHDVKNRLAILAGELAKLNGLGLPTAAAQHARAAGQQASAVTHKLVEYLTLRRAATPEGLRADVHDDEPVRLLEELQADAVLLAGGRIEVQVDVTGAPAFWFYDRYLVLMALGSALYNALRFANTRITLGARAVADADADPVAQGMVFFVRDDGPGLQTAPDAGSTGLGLRVCRAIAQAHLNQGINGHCVLRDERGGGAVFELHLP